MLTDDVYQELMPYRDLISHASQGNRIKVEVFHKVYFIYRNKIAGSINEFCSSCITDMYKRTMDYIIEYEQYKTKQNGST